MRAPGAHLMCFSAVATNFPFCMINSSSLSTCCSCSSFCASAVVAPSPEDPAEEEEEEDDEEEEAARIGNLPPDKEEVGGAVTGVILKHFLQ